MEDCLTTWRAVAVAVVIVVVAVVAVAIAVAVAVAVGCCCCCCSHPEVTQKFWLATPSATIAAKAPVIDRQQYCK